MDSEGQVTIFDVIGVINLALGVDEMGESPYVSFVLNALFACVLFPLSLSLSLSSTTKSIPLHDLIASKVCHLVPPLSFFLLLLLRKKKKKETNAE